MLFGGLDNIRDCIAFPKTQRATDLMTGAPGAVEAKQLKELGIKLDLVGGMRERRIMVRRLLASILMSAVLTVAVGCARRRCRPPATLGHRWPKQVASGVDEPCRRVDCSRKP